MIKNKGNVTNIRRYGKGKLDQVRQISKKNFLQVVVSSLFLFFQYKGYKMHNSVIYYQILIVLKKPYNH